MTVVSNAGPLIALARIEQTGWLPALYGDIVVPVAVRNEVIGPARKRAGAEALASANWLRVEQVSDQTAVTLLRESLDAGESETIVLALELGADIVLMDEAPGRRIADARGLTLTGTLGILLAKQDHLIDKVAPALDELISTGFRVSETLYHDVLRQAGEA